MIIGTRLMGRRLALGRRVQARLLEGASGRSRPPVRPVRALNTESDAAGVPEVGWMWQAGTVSAAGKAGATRANLKQANIKAKKSLGQNFLTDEAVLKGIVAAAGVQAGDVVLEVGPGTGNLTRFLVATGAQVIAVEKDDTLVERLREEFAQTPNLQLIHGDILRVGIPGILQQMQDRHEQQQAAARAATDGSADSGAAGGAREQQPGASTSGRGAPPGGAPSWRQRGGGGGRGSLKVVANLPYNITKEFLKATLPLGGSVSELSIMIQHEVAQRLVDPTPGRPDYRAMSVYTHFYSSPKYRLRIPRQKYFPVPGVDGALVTFRLAPPDRRAAVPSERGFHALVAKAFSERRKMMRNSMQPMYTSQQVEAALEEVKVRKDARAQELSAEQFVQLHWALHRMKPAGGAGAGEAPAGAAGGAATQSAGASDAAAAGGAASDGL
ncbi:MAG: S-adenosyl-L-methionine-dependent methyltransferase [Monoraphidium minutum]|nr:MAG: S-adenosyl-L-methionine-dependent methyltransferase [Monoraphidium minutum]